MSHNIETMAYARLDERSVPWHKLGTAIGHAMTQQEAYELGGFNWLAEFAPIEAVITCADGTTLRKKIAHRFAVVRNTDHLIMGEVSDDYRIVQNHEAFAFTADLAGLGVKFETAGVIRNPYNDNVKTWMLARTNHIDVLGDRIDPYIVFMNSFDGHSGIIAAMTPVRVVCNNTLTMALERTPRMWFVRHTGDINQKLEEAKRALGLISDYVDGFPEAAEELAAINIYNDEVVKFLDELFPAPEEGDTDLRKQHREYLKGFVMNRYTVPTDIQKFFGTGWGLYNAVIDAVTHMPPLRKTKNWQENRFVRVVEGDAIIMRAQKLLMRMKV